MKDNNIFINTLIWNCQRINIKLGRRDIKINFLKDILYFNKLDIIYLIDIENFQDGIFLSCYYFYKMKKANFKYYNL